MPAPDAVDESKDSNVAAHWPLLGYDVADAWQVSGLNNCGYSHEEKAALVDVWKSRLTTGGLIRTLEWAREFVTVANERVLEHAPFYVYEVRSPDVTQSVAAEAVE
jgi:hypothetical protein